MDTIDVDGTFDTRVASSLSATRQATVRYCTHQNYRRHKRFRSLKRGRILYNLGRSSLDVQITNQSSCGAKIRLTSIWIAPTLFDLQIFDPNKGTYECFKCRLVWHKGYEMGVHKISSASSFP